MKKVRVRIAVAVDYDGNWHACASSDQRESESSDLAVDAVPGAADACDIRVSFVEADVPMPEPQPETTIEGTVSQ